MTRCRKLLGATLALAALSPAGTAAAAGCEGPACTRPVTLPHVLPFNGSGSGIADARGAGTGFTLVQTGGSGGLRSDLLSQANGLRIRTTPGAPTWDVDTQDNMLGVALPADDARGGVVLETSVRLPPAGTGQYEQGGLWYGTSQGNYVKLVVISRGGLRVHMLHEGDNLIRRSRYGPELTGAPRQVVLRLRIDAAGGVTGAYAVDGAPARALSRWNLPAGLRESAPSGQISRGGLFATQRFGPASLTYEFGPFKARCGNPACEGPAGPDPELGDGTSPVGGLPEGEEPTGPGADGPPAGGGSGEPGGAPAPSRSITGRTLSVHVARKVQLRKLKRRGLPTRIACSARCRLSVDLRARPGRRGSGTRVGYRKGVAPGAAARRFGIRLAPSAGRRLRKANRVVVRTQARFADGSTAFAKRTVRLRR